MSEKYRIDWTPEIFVSLLTENLDNSPSYPHTNALISTKHPGREGKGLSTASINSSLNRTRKLALRLVELCDAAEEDPDTKAAEAALDAFRTEEMKGWSEHLTAELYKLGKKLPPRNSRKRLVEMESDSKPDSKRGPKRVCEEEGEGDLEPPRGEDAEAVRENTKVLVSAFTSVAKLFADVELSREQTKRLELQLKWGDH